MAGFLFGRGRIVMRDAPSNESEGQHVEPRAVGQFQSGRHQNQQHHATTPGRQLPGFSLKFGKSGDSKM
jgi:hypothetical protein